MTTTDIEYMERTLSKDFIDNSTDPTWRRAFEQYNYNNKKSLKMSCSPCYTKVLLYSKKNVRKD